MNKSHCLALPSITLCLCLSACDKPQENTPAASPPAKRAAIDPQPPAADNTARNTGDASSGVKTPLDQSESSASIKITADIRKAILDDSSMSINAQNCKVITDKDGVVTLRGPVNSQAEKALVEQKAKGTAGVVRVDNQLEVKAG